MEGLKFSKAAFIITDHYEQVAKRIMTELERGVTGLRAKGMYSGAEKCMLYCVVSKKEIVQVKEIVREVDPDAFVIVSVRGKCSVKDFRNRCHKFFLCELCTL